MITTIRQEESVDDRSQRDGFRFGTYLSEETRKKLQELKKNLETKAAKIEEKKS